MKLKLLSLILALATLLTLTACGNEEAQTIDNDKNESSFVESSIAESSSPEPSNDSSVADDSVENNVSDETSEAIPEKEPFPFAGTWRRIQENAKTTNDYIVIDEAGNKTEYQFDDDGNLKTTETVLAEDNEEIIIGEKVRLKYDRKDKGYHFNAVTFLPIGNNYGLSIENRENYGSWIYYYREEDFNSEDYEIVELTNENVSQYVEYVFKSPEVKTDDYGKISISIKDGSFRLKEELGMPSFLLGDLIIKQNYKTAIFNPETNEIIPGEIVDTDYDISRKWNLSVLGSVDFADSPFHKYPGFTDNGDGTYTLDSVYAPEVIGANRIIGKVYVPKNWNK